jgi:hypothetical protein
MQCRSLSEKTEWKHSVPAKVVVVERHFYRPDRLSRPVPRPLLEIINAGSNGKINTDFYANSADAH